MPTYAELSDGQTAVLVPDGATDEDLNRITNDGETKLASQYQEQARTQGHPVTTPGHTYSSTATYPNTTAGQFLAWRDHHLGGNLWNRYVSNPVDAATGDALTHATNIARRAAIHTVAGIPDTAVAALNALYPGKGDPVPYPSDWLEREFGAEMPKDASIYQRLAEGILTGVVAGPAFGQAATWRNMLRNAGLAAGGEAGSAAGGVFGGETGALLGGLALGGGVPYKALGAKLVGLASRSDQSGPVWRAAEALRPKTPGANFPGLDKPAPKGMEDFSDYRPDYITMANTLGKRIAAFIRSIPYSGNPLANANERTRRFLYNVKQNTGLDPMANPLGAHDIAGPETIGRAVIRGAQEANANTNINKNARESAFGGQMTGANQIAGGNQTPNSAHVPIGGIIRAGLKALTGAGKRGDAETAATLNILEEIRRLGVAGPNGLPVGNWLALRDIAGRLRASLDGSGLPTIPDDISSTIKKAINDARENTAELIQAGSGKKFRDNLQAYQDDTDKLERLRQMSGEERLTEFKDAQGNPVYTFKQEGKGSVPGEAQAANQMLSNMRSPNKLAIFSDPAFPPDARLDALGTHVQTLGSAKQDDFRPEQFFEDYAGSKTGTRPGIETLAHDDRGNFNTVPILDNAATIAKNFSVTPSRAGLTSQIGAGAGVVAGMNVAEKAAHAVLPAGTAVAAVPLLMRYAAKGLESEPVARAMAGLPQDLTNYYSRLPVTAAVLSSQRPDPQNLYALASPTAPTILSTGAPQGSSNPPVPPQTLPQTPPQPQPQAPPVQAPPVQAPPVQAPPTTPGPTQLSPQILQALQAIQAIRAPLLPQAAPIPQASAMPAVPLLPEDAGTQAGPTRAPLRMTIYGGHYDPNQPQPSQ